MATPYISVVVTTRNDNYGENMQDRLHMFVNSLNNYSKIYPGLLELVVVEWNPPTNTAPLSSIIPQCDSLPIRIITVSPEIHDQYKTKAPVLEFLAKNVGIRNSHGEYVLVTNPDILFSSQMMHLFSLKQLEPDVLYRTDRFDFNGKNIKINDVTSYEPYAIDNTFQGHLSDDQTYAILPNTKLSDFPVSDYNRLHTNATGDFIMSSRNTFFKINGLYENLEFTHHSDSVSVIRFFYNKIPQCILTAPMCIFHYDHSRGNRDPWNPNKAHALGNSIGLENWGLNNYNLKEWSNIV
jgi:hypothetical protein